MEWANIAPRAKKTPSEDNRMKTNDNDAEREETDGWDTLMEDENFAHAPRDYVMDRIVCNIGRGDNVR